MNMDRGSIVFLGLALCGLLFLVAHRKTVLPALSIDPVSFDENLSEFVPGLSNQVAREPTIGPAYMGANWGFPRFMQSMMPVTSTGTEKNSSAACGSC